MTLKKMCARTVNNIITAKQIGAVSGMAHSYTEHHNISYNCTVLSVYLSSGLKKAAGVLFCILMAYGALAQQKEDPGTITDSVVTPKMVEPMRKPEPGSDVDRLWVLYRDTDVVMIPLDGRAVKAHVQILYNADKKPYSVIAYGEADADSTHALDKLVHELITEKLKVGYHQIPGRFSVAFNPGGTFENKFEVVLYQKGSQFAKYGTKKIIYNPSVHESVPQYVGDSFYFEVVDESRRPVAGGAKKFVF
ncbi:hypothetical protein HH214_03935 [Mucilaginibacter robiniae]|uniref:Uncharacterized protein n=1 Tax=Mucilaginibacter robiniae TaxID=2728022 RepID=A0A7L5E407_9SPHI|nr:hypothetical protein [Mucilaginibacter robiniae]QJD95086.1 hypothetical protein HH214_03935 [Mucilaginibacter robiniae]